MNAADPNELATGRMSPVLVVDDDFEIRESLAEILREEGYTVCTSENGSVALEALKGGLAPGLVLLDLMMPVMDGTTLCRTCKQDPVLASIPVVILSADRGVSQKALACGANAHLLKPIQLEKLLKTVAQYVG